MLATRRLALVARSLTTRTLGVPVPALGTSSKDAAGAKELYDTWADGYDSALESWGYPAPRRAAEVLASSGVDRSARVLDVGCGTGMSGAALSAHGIGIDGGVVGTDISQTSLDIAQGKGFYSSTVMANLEEPLPFDAASFHAAVSVGVLSYVENFDVLFKDLCRVLRPGGLFVATHRDNLWDEDFRGCQTAAAALVEAGAWTIESVGAPEPYMPYNPDPAENSKRIRLLVFKRA